MKKDVFVRGCYGKALKQIRKDKRLGLNKVANKAGISSGNLSKMENGKKNLMEHTLEKILLAMNVSFSMFASYVQDYTDYLSKCSFVTIHKFLRFCKNCL